jgi:two-component system NtrC family sensor kinase
MERGGQGEHGAARPSFLDQAFRPRVLAADDIPANLALLEAILAPLDCEFVTTDDGVRALEAVLQQDYAVLLLDVQMPGMDGYEVARRVRQGSRNQDVPIIFVTASAHDDDSVIRGYGLGAVDYLFKPVDVTVLRSKVKVFLDLYTSKERIARAKDELEEAYRELKATQTQLVQSAKMASLGTLVAGVAHEINNPLSFCLGHVQTALSDITRARDSLPSEDLGQGCERAIVRLEQTQGGLSRIRDLVAKLRMFSRLDEGATKLVDVRDSVASVIAMLEHRVRNRVVVTTEFAPPATLECQPGSFNQAIMNLVSNAIDAIDASGTVHVECGADAAGANYVVRVTDSGPGIPAELLQRVFEPFFTTKAVGEGTGLGLAITYSIAEAHGGTLRLENGEIGALATLSIPIGVAD